MTPQILTTFIINTLKAKIQDTFAYTTFAWGNITARFGSTIFYQNTDFDNADIVITPDVAYVDYKEIDLPLDSAGKIKQGTYEVTYDVKVEERVLSSAGDLSIVAIGSSTFDTITMSPGLSIGDVNTITNIISEYGTIEMVLFNAGGEQMLLVEGVSSVTGGTITFPEITFNDFGDVSYVRFYVPAFYQKTFTYNFCDETPVSELCVTHNCFTSQLSVIDNTIYPADVTVVSRELTIQWPRLQNGTPVQPAVEIASASYTIGPNIYTGNYTITNVVEVLYTGTDGLIQTNTITTYQEHEVSCDAGLCDLFNCINSLRSQYESAVRNGGRKTKELEQINFQVMLYVQAYKLAAECEKTQQAEAILTALKDYIGANTSVIGTGCGCGCTDSDSNNNVPSIIYPLYGGSGGTGTGTVTTFSTVLGTSGNDVNISVANPTTTPELTINIPTASATKRGALSTSDWTTFNNKVAKSGDTMTGDLTFSGNAGVVTAKHLGLNTASPGTVGVGKTVWNDTFGTSEMLLKGGNVSAYANQTLQFLCRNSTGSGLSKGQVVYVSGSTGTNKTIALAQSNAGATSDTTIGIVAEAISNGQDGFVTSFGWITGLNTSALTEGAPVYLSSTTPGGLTSSNPSAPNKSVVVGICVRQHASQGTIFVNVRNDNSFLSNTLASSRIFVGNASSVATGVVLSLNATGGSFGLSNAGVLTMPDADTGTRGLLLAADWNTFNNKRNDIETYSVSATTIENTSVADKVYICDAISGGFDISVNPIMLNLKKRVITVVKTDKTSNTVKIYPPVGSKFNGGGTGFPIILSCPNDTATIYYDGLGGTNIQYTLKHFPVKKTGVTSATSFVVPAGYMIKNIIIKETAGNAVTGGLKFGTTLGGTDVIAAQAVGANSLTVVKDADLLLRMFDVLGGSNQTVYIDALTSWNSAELDMSIEIEQVL